MDINHFPQETWFKSQPCDLATNLNIQWKYVPPGCIKVFWKPMSMNMFYKISRTINKKVIRVFHSMYQTTRLLYLFFFFFQIFFQYLFKGIKPYQLLFNIFCKQRLLSCAVRIKLSLLMFKYLHSLDDKLISHLLNTQLRC